jgi:mono/diheme cytochrome c family protein/plastocyanin
MKHKEWMARLFVLSLLALALGAPLIGWRQQAQNGVLLRGRMAETGGWTPENLSVAVGETLYLRLTSDDVLHSFAIGRSDMPPVDILPGEITELNLVFDQPGKYTFYCTRWCSINHWRMRGVIEVVGAGQPGAALESPLYVRLGIDLDSTVHTALTPEEKPAAWRGQEYTRLLPAAALGSEVYLTQAPVDYWQALRSTTALAHLTDQQVWDLAAWVWASNTAPQELEEGQQLYAVNCAACHGESGGGDGVFAAQLDQADPGEHTMTIPGGAPDAMPSAISGVRTTRPTDFTNPAYMLALSSARLQGKILRGGMGTGMPYWGPIFTESQTWALIAYLWTFQFDLGEKP